LCTLAACCHSAAVQLTTLPSVITCNNGVQKGEDHGPIRFQFVSKYAEAPMGIGIYRCNAGAVVAGGKSLYVKERVEWQPVQSVTSII
jgi:hypothetical protein